MAKLMLIASNDDYRAMVIFKSLLLMGIDRVPLDKVESDHHIEVTTRNSTHNDPVQCR